jgi:hypothetical protein
MKFAPSFILSLITYAAAAPLPIESTELVAKDAASYAAYGKPANGYTKYHKPTNGYTSYPKPTNGYTSSKRAIGNLIEQFRA